ncbi:MAG TPA: hypothetical protein VKT73_15255 [Xanthobacteraceae bacterium]|nr:hypothetical protein [Xanthobacteraceae bacterium]
MATEKKPVMVARPVSAEERKRIEAQMRRDIMDGKYEKLLAYLAEH